MRQAKPGSRLARPGWDCASIFAKFMGRAPIVPGDHGDPERSRLPGVSSELRELEASFAVREIGTLPKELDPRVFTDYLLTLGTTTRIDPSSEGWSVWVHNEDHVARARQELEAFVKDPNDPRYHDAKATAQAARRQEAEANRRFRKNFRDMSGSWDRPPAWRRRPVTITLIATSVAVYVLVWY